ncbi:endonuclease III [Caldalkalibacillus uzonensis]|uniref:Endonuclease III n=1 Tax=Caldalkalibacillus uzonensis TaxID=353224 RepID=A0ABU0CWW5_9BACI|nr:hypothetical protein [Caldalkalibacillus uzonensis]MDQ0340913.1 endonuclease III [Caldalkalibacillus uzonensis]
MANIPYAEVIEEIKNTMTNNGHDYEASIKSFGQVEACIQRDQGYQFTFKDHLRGLILAMLSNQRPWGPIDRNMNRIENIFFHFDADKLLQADKHLLAEKLKKIKCGNRAIVKQMESLNDNIGVLRQIEKDSGSIDRFVTSDTPHRIAEELGKGNKYKLKQVGYTLALEYLRNVGIKAIKPDVHIRRIISAERLGWCDHYPSESEAVRILEHVSKQTGIHISYLDNLLWLFGAVDYANICNAQPRCHVCTLRNRYCRYGRK